MMTLLSGQPGNGKTLKAMELLEIEYLRNADKVKQGKEQPRQFFSNVKGSTRVRACDRPGCCEDNPEAFEWVQPLPLHNDWTKLPEGAFVIYDECHSDGNTPGLEHYGVLFPSTGKPGESNDPRIRSMSTHRHRGIDMLLVTQWPSKVHHNVRQLIGKHIHMNRAMGMQRAGVLTWSRAQPDPYDEKQREKAEEEIWAYPKHLYGRYKSSTLHTAEYRFKVPKKLWGALAQAGAMLLVMWLLWLFVFRPDPVKASEKETAQAAPHSQASLLAGGGLRLPADVQIVPNPNHQVSTDAQPNTASSQTVEPLAGYVITDRGCRAFDTDGLQLDLTDSACRDLAARRLPINLFHRYAAASGAAPAGQGGGTAPTVNASPGVVVPGGQVSGYGQMGYGDQAPAAP